MFVNVVVPPAFFQVCIQLMVPPANGQYIVYTEFAATTSHHASKPEQSKLVASQVALSAHSVSVYIAELSNIFLTGILKDVFHQVNFVQVSLLAKAFAT